MTITISVSPETESRLKAGAAANGTDLNQYATELLENAVTASSSAAPPTIAKADSERMNAWNSFVNGMTEAGKKLPTGSNLDDSREGIYAGRGE